MKKIYRYRTFGKEYSLDDLKNNTITGVTNDLMNDPYDCHFYFEFDEVKLFVQEKKLYEKLINCSSNPEVRILGIDELIKYIANHLEKCIELEFLTTCFTNSNNKEIMWAHYSNNATGYVLEYDLDEIKNKVNILKENDPFNATKIEVVKYTKEKSDFTNFVMKYIDNIIKIPNLRCLDILDLPENYFDFNRPLIELAKNIVFEKNIDWAYEEEYRLVMPNMKREGNDVISTYDVLIKDINVKTIYLGEKCSKKDEDEIVKIAKDKNIKVYKMKTNYYDKKYCLSYEEIL